LQRYISGDATHIVGGVRITLDFDVDRGESAFAMGSRPLELK
jgi:hypothetical protein